MASEGEKPQRPKKGLECPAGQTVSAFDSAFIYHEVDCIPCDGTSKLTTPGLKALRSVLAALRSCKPPRKRKKKQAPGVYCALCEGEVSREEFISHAASIHQIEVGELGK